MKKLFICFLLGLFLYGCSEINEPVNVTEKNTTKKTNREEIQPSKLVIIKPDSGKIIMFSDSIWPPSDKYYFCDSIWPPCDYPVRSIPTLIPVK